MSQQSGNKTDRELHAAGIQTGESVIEASKHVLLVQLSNHVMHLNKKISDNS